MSQLAKYITYSLVIIVLLNVLIETWLYPDEKGIGHALIYMGLAFVFGFAGLVVLILPLLKKTSNLFSFLKVFFGISNSLFVVVLASCFGADISIILLFSFTTFTGFALLYLSVKQITATKQ